MKRLILFALVALTMLAAGLPAAAAAAASTGAHVIDATDYHWEPDGSVWHFTLKGVTTETLTPEGNKIYTGRLASTSALYDADGTLVLTGAGTSRTLRLIKDPSSGDSDNFHVWADRLEHTMTLADGTVCTSSFTLHYANGQFQLLDAEQVCT